MRHRMCRKLYDLHINSMTYTLFLFHIINFIKYFYVSLGNNFLLFFCGGPWATVTVCPPPLNPALNKSTTNRSDGIGAILSRWSIRFAAWSDGRMRDWRLLIRVQNSLVRSFVRRSHVHHAANLHTARPPR